MEEPIIKSRTQSQTLDARISAALGNEAVGSADDLEALVQEAEIATQAAASGARTARGRALDIASTPGAAERAAADAAASKLLCDRLNAALPRLQQKLAEALAAEYHDKWLADFRRIEQQRDKLADEFAEVYARVAAQLVDLFARMAATDRECSRVNSAAPDGASERLDGVELTARNFRHFTTDNPSLLEIIKLFDLGGEQLWPVPTPSIAASFAASMGGAYDPAYSSDWHTARDRRTAAIANEQQRVGDYNAERARQHEERLNDEEKQRFAANAR